VRNSFYHVYNRGAHKSQIFFDDIDFNFLKHISILAFKRHHIAEYSYSILPNHYHFLLFQRDERSISKAMHEIAVNYGLFLRSKYKHSGRVFQGPYRARLLYTPGDILFVKNYIQNNHIEAKLYGWKHYGIKLDQGLPL
jgi:putative transposase